MRGCARKLGRPTAFTLIELLVVISLVVVLLALVVALAPRLRERQKVTKGADLLQQWLLTAKRQAVRDRSPRGVRLVPLDTSTRSLQAVTAGSARPVTPAALGGFTDGLPWRILPESIVIVYDPDPADPSLTVNLEAVQVGTVSAGSFTADFSHNHAAGFIIKVLAYAKDVQYIEQPEDFVAQPGFALPPGVDPLPNISVRRIKVDATALNVAVLERLPLNPPPSPLPPLRPPLLPPGKTGVAAPADFTGGYGFRYSDPRATPDIGPTLNPLGPRSPSLWPVQPGDYLELKGGGLLHRIQTVTYSTWPNDPPPARRLPAPLRRDPVPGSNPPVLEGNTLVLQAPLPYPIDYTKDYRILRSPRPQLGALPLQLPEGVAIDLTTNFTFAAAGAPPLPIDPITGNIDLLFSPFGGVAGRGSAGDRIALWLRDVTLDPEQPGEQILMTVYARSGLVAAHPVDTANNYADPYQFTRDGQSSGL